MAGTGPGPTNPKINKTYPQAAMYRLYWNRRHVIRVPTSKNLNVCVILNRK